MPLSSSSGSASSEDTIQRILSHGTPYSNLRSPSASTDMVVWKVRRMTRLPIRSAGAAMPEAALTKIWFCENSRRGKAGMPTNGSPRLTAMMWDDSEVSAMSNSPSCRNRRWRSMPSRRGGAMPTSNGLSRKPLGGVSVPMKNGTWRS